MKGPVSYTGRRSRRGRVDGPNCIVLYPLLEQVQC